MKTLPLLTIAGLLLAGCTYGDKLTSTNPFETAARDTHAAFLKSDAGFGVDPSAPFFYDSFETNLSDRWASRTPSTTAMSDTWQVSGAAMNFGSKSATYQYNNQIVRATEFGEATLTTKDAIALTTAKAPALVFFALFDQQGSKEDKTSFKVEISPDLGFTWTALAPVGATDPVIAAEATPAKIWKRYRYNLNAYAGQVVQVRFLIKATMGDQKLLFLDDVLIAETQK